MKMTIDSKLLNRRLTFSRPGKEYIYIDLNGQPGTLGLQICDGGRLSGSTLTCSRDEQARFESICRRWYRAHVRALKNECAL